jgi:hypothetical protein
LSLWHSRRNPQPERLQLERHRRSFPLRLRLHSIVTGCTSFYGEIICMLRAQMARQ